MPITANCPSCAKALSVADQYAGQKGKCPFCGTVFTFPSAGPAMPPMPPPVMPVAMEPPPVQAAAWGGPPPMPAFGAAPVVGAGLPMPLIDLILYGTALFFLFFFFIMCFVSWASASVSGMGFGTVSNSASGMKFGTVVFLFILDLFLMLGVGAGFTLTFIPQTKGIGEKILYYGNAAGGFFGTLAVLSILGLIIGIPKHSSAPGVNASLSVRIGAWLGFLSVLVVCGVFVFQLIRKPVELPVPNNPFVQKWLVLTVALGFAGLLGLIIFIVNIV